MTPRLRSTTALPGGDTQAGRPARLPRVVSAGAAVALLLPAGPALAGSHQHAAPSHRSAPSGLTQGRLAPARAGASGLLSSLRHHGSMRSAVLTWLAAQNRAIALDPGGFSLFREGCEVDEGGGASGAGSIPLARGATQSSVIGSLLIPAGDLDGDGKKDVVDWRIGESGNSISTGTTARSSKTGTGLWSRQSNGSANELAIESPYPDAVGADHKPGVVLIRSSIPFSNAETVTVSTRIRAIDGAGTTLFNKTVSGQVTQASNGDETLTNFPVLNGLVHDAHHRGYDFLIDVLNGTSSGSDNSDSGSDQPELLSAVDGSIGPVGAPIASSKAIPQVISGPDLNRDKLTDLLVLNHNSVSAERSDTGVQIWTSSVKGADEDSGITAVGAVSNAHVSDLALTSYVGYSSPKVTLLAGPSGKKLWAHKADCAFQIGRSGKHKRRAVGLVTGTSGGGGSKSANAHFTLAARTASDTLVLSKRIEARATSAKPRKSSSYEVEIQPFGDVQPDGSQDLEVRLNATIGKHTVRRHGIVSGRNGALISEPLGLPAAGSLHRGNGDDLLLPSRVNNHVRLRGYDAASGRLLYQHAIARTSGLRTPLSFGLRVTDHHCSDIGLSASNNHRRIIGLYAGNGSPLWVVTATSKQLRGGTVHRPATPARFCV